MSNEILDKLIDVVVNGKIKDAKPLAEQALAAGIEPKIIIFETLNDAMKTVSQRYESKKFFLPQVLLAAQTMYQALDVVLPRLKVDNKAKVPCKLVLAVVEGDVHDIGKNILKAILTGAGFTIFDLGRDVPVKNIIEKAKAENAQVIGTSTLMTSTLPAMREIERMLVEENQKGDIKTIIGGGATTKEFQEQIGTDAWASSATDAVKAIDGLLA